MIDQKDGAAAQHDTSLGHVGFVQRRAAKAALHHGVRWTIEARTAPSRWDRFRTVQPALPPRVIVSRLLEQPPRRVG